MRKRRAGLAQAEKGLNLALTSVMNFVIILAADWAREARAGLSEGEVVVRLVVVDFLWRFDKLR